MVVVIQMTVAMIKATTAVGLLMMAVMIAVLVLPAILVQMMVDPGVAIAALALLALVQVPVILVAVVRVVALEEALQGARQEVTDLEEELQKEAKVHRVIRRMEVETRKEAR